VLKIAVDGEVVDVKIDPFGQNVQKPDPIMISQRSLEWKTIESITTKYDGKYTRERRRRRNE
jgi:hypothetical protein